MISTLSGKLLSLGTLLAAYEFRKIAGIAHVEASGYTMSESINEHEELFEMWLAGEAYES